MSSRKAIIRIIAATTGRQVNVAAQATGTALLRYLASQVLALLRGVLAQVLVAKRPRMLFLDRGARIRGLRALRFGSRLRLGTRSSLVAWSHDGITIGDDFSLGEHAVISNGFSPFGEIGQVRIGSHVGIGGFSYICCPSQLTIGDHTITGQYLSIHAQNHVYGDRDRPIRLQGTTAAGVHIGADCWLGAKVTILDGVSLGEGCIVAAGAVVTKSFPPFSIVAGVPAKLIGHR